MTVKEIISKINKIYKLDYYDKIDFDLTEGVSLSKDEMDAIQKIKKNGLTEYQQRSLEMLGHEAPYVDMVYEADKEIKLENQIVRETKLERLKSHTMEDAQKQAEEVLEAASKEVVGMLVDEAKEHIDEEAEEREEKAEAEKEKQEEEERKKQERAKEAAKYCITLY